MKMINKAAALITAAVILLFTMTACGSDGTAQVPTGSSSHGHEASSSSTCDIGAEKATEIVLGKVPGAVADSIYELERDHEDGRVVYEGNVYHDGYEYEFEIDGETGNILKWEIDD